MSYLQVHQLSKTFNTSPAVSNISFELEQGQILCLLGPSGCGKTTLLRLIAGLERADNGSILFEGHDISPVPPHRRDFGLMFQEFALFPHKNVGQNIAFGLRLQSHQAEASRVQEMLALVDLAGYTERDVSTLSGGERQRVALARSLAPSPRLLMLDEPLGALDRALRERLMVEIRHILKTIGLTAIYVTHDQTEAYAVADRIIVLNAGQIEQDATPTELYKYPETPFVARFLGFSNLLEATCTAPGQFESSLGIWPIAPLDFEVGQTAMLLLRPEAALLHPANGALPLHGKVTATVFRGRYYQLTLLTSGLRLTFEMSIAEIPATGSSIELWLDPAAILRLPLEIQQI